LARLLKDPVLAKFSHEITKDIDLQKFIADSKGTQGGMVGSASLLWPDDPIRILGLKYLLIMSFAEDPEQVLQFGFTFYYSNDNLNGTFKL
jgi:hypothetical protein